MLIDLTDITWGIALTIWVGFVTLYLSRIIADKKGTYVARKFIHILGGGVVAVLGPFVFSSPLIPIILPYILTIYLLLHRKGKMLSWFQDKGDMGEVFFTFSFGTILLLSWVLIPSFWDPGNKLLYVALLPLFYMSFGDGITGIIRNYVYGKRMKGNWGSLGMLVLCATLGYLLLSYVGLLSGIIATVLEKYGKLDDNLTVSFGTFLFLILTLRFL
ncbi:hypothetical protein [Candidatus Acidianus copahuensis]|uniref:Phosphatidate cytidylyltransferase n=1 Tax=Candidatus Acidianus copahuensis TaxID=1160895 RepID=A0A031LMV4_9CREN|nr:hypothetical protein [Candidatus Acidianus copahuensis]EZQ04806.1 phosphatidate cytidylyltransferase [Candidatus Acidianus copahuensis]NON63203.1 phosphatidate cytidylyltransferase [Acidianus sp. RZ1]